MTCGSIDIRCTKCRLSASRTIVVGGSGPCDARLVLVGEAPGREEDEAGSPFVGRAGKILDEAFDRAGISRDEVYITNVVKCRPPSNRRPRTDEVTTCIGYLASELREIQPKVVCLLGQTAMKTVLGNRSKMASAVGRSYEATIGERVFTAFVAYHPAACLYRREYVESLTETLRAGASAAGLI